MRHGVNNQFANGCGLSAVPAEVITYEAALAGLERGSCSLSTVALLHELEAHYLQD